MESDVVSVRKRTPEQHTSHIRPVRATDREPIRRLLAETDVFTEEEVGIALELIDVIFERPDQQDYIARAYDDGGQVLGYYCIGPTPATQGTFDLYWIAVSPEAHGSGVGGALDAHAASLIRSMEGRLVIAETSSQPRYAKTRQFYLHHGYTEAARIPGYYRPGDDLVVFVKSLQP